MTLFSGLIALLLGSPRWLPLPWSDFHDYVEATDGRVYVDIGFYSRVLCYDHNGNFVASYRAPVEGGGDHALAADAAGHLYYRWRNTVYIFNKDWQRIGLVRAEDSANRTWVLNSAGQPEYAPNAQGPVPEHAVAPGEILFAYTGRHRSYRSSDGTFLNLRGNSLVRKTERGETVATYGTPWLLTPIVFPVPAAIGCALTFLWLLFDERKRNRKRVWHSPTASWVSPSDLSPDPEAVRKESVTIERQ